MQNSNIEKLVIEYLENNVVENIKEEFLNAAIHFIINEEVCSKEDILRTKYRLKKIKSNEVTKFITMEIDEEDLYKNIKLAISSLYIGDDCNNKVLEKFRGCSIVF